MKSKGEKRGFITLLGLLLAIALIYAVIYMLSGVYSGATRKQGDSDIGVLPGERSGGLKPQAITQGVKTKIGEINKQRLEQLETLEK